MNINDLKIELQTIYNLAEYGEGDEACIKFSNLIAEAEKSNYYEINELYYKFALLLFENCFFEDSIKNFSKAYNNNYNKKKIKDLMFNCFINPNLEEFKTTFNKNIELYLKNSLNCHVNYEDIPYEFIPINNNKYYIFDLINDNFNLSIDFDSNPILFNDSFSDIILDIDDFQNYSYIYTSNDINKKIYYICEDTLKLFSLFKLPNIKESFIYNLNPFKTYDELEKYLWKTQQPLPYNILISSCENKVKIESLINKIHSSRIHSSDIDRTKILLTICIINNNFSDDGIFKTLAQLSSIPYDVEIEFLIINNSITKSLDCKNKITQLNDYRINYIDIIPKQNNSFSFLKGLEASLGKFILYLNSGDFLNLDSLTYYMSLLKNNNWGLIRSGTSSSYSDLSDLSYTAGEKAFLSFFLQNNSLNGMIYNKTAIRDLNLEKILYDSIIHNNEFSCTYPNMFLDSFILLKYDFHSESKLLCIENPRVSTENNIKPEENDFEINLGYSSLRSRIKQHIGAVDLINSLDLSINTMLYAYISLCWKTIYLVSLVKKTYLDNNYSISDIKDELFNCCQNGLKNLKIQLTQNIQSNVESYINKYLNEFWR